MKTLLLLLLPAVLFAAEPAIEQIFDDPKQLVPKEGTNDLSRVGKENVASGNGARTRLILNLAKNTEAGGTGKPPIQFVAEPAFGSRPVFRSQILPDGGIRSAGLVVMPDARDGGLTQLTKFGDGSSTLSGGFDFFFRLAADRQDVASGFSLWVWSGLLGVNLVPSRDNKVLLLGVFAPEKVLSVPDKANEKISRVFGKRFGEVEWTNGQVYHAAVLFTSSGEDISVKLFLQEGTGPIDVAAGNALHAEIEGLRIASAERLEDDGDKFAFELSRTDFAQTFDLARFRLFTSPPAVFPGLSQ